MNEYDEIIAADKPAPKNEYDNLIQGGQGQLDLTVNDAVRGNPEQAGKLVRAQRELGEPYALGRANPTEAVKAAEAQRAKVVVKGNPFIQDAVRENPAFADVAADDWGVLDALSKAWGFNTKYNPVAVMAASLVKPDPIGAAATALGAPAFGTGTKRGAFSEVQGLKRVAQDVEGAQAYEKAVAALPQPEGGLPYYAGMAGEMLGALGVDLGAGGVAGGLVGSGVPVVGTVLGAMGGMAAASGNAAAGRALMLLEAEEAATGQALDPTAKYAAVAAIGSINFGANMLGLKVGGKAVGELTSEAATAALARPGVMDALGRAAAATGKGGATGGGLMATMVAAESILEDAARTASPGSYETVFNDSTKRVELLGNLTQAFADGFVLMGALHAVPAGRNFVNDVRLAKEAAAGKEGLRELVAAVEQSKTKLRDPETFKDFAARHGGEELTITREGALEVPEGVGRRMPDGAVRIPLADYLALEQLAQLHAKVADDIQHTPDGISVNEAQAIADHHDDPMAREEAAWNSFLTNKVKPKDFATDSIMESSKIIGSANGLSMHLLGDDPPGSKGPQDYTLMNNGEELGTVTVEAEGNTLYIHSIYTAYMGGDSNMLGTRPMLQLMREYAKVHPEIEYLSGHRVTGSRVGGSTDRDIKVKISRIKEDKGSMGGRGDRSDSEPPPPLAPAEPDLTLRAADAEIEGMYLQPLFPDAGSVGMTEGEFARYGKRLETWAEARRARSEAKAIRAAAAAQTPAYREREAIVRTEVEADVDNRPVIVAERTIRTGEAPDGGGKGNYRLDSEIVDTVSRPGTSQLLSGLVKRGRTHPDELAGILGFQSGPELVQALLGLKVERQRLGLGPKEYRDRLVREETRARMDAEHEPLKDNITAEARELAVMPAATEVLNAEREHLARLAGMEAGATAGDLRTSVAVEFAALPAGEARDLKGYMRSVARAGREAELALLRGDFVAAFDAKQRQQVSHLYAEQAKGFVRTEQRAGKWLKMYSENVKLEAVSQEYTNQVQALAQSLGLTLRRDAKDLAEVIKGQSLERFIAAKNENLGGLIPDQPLPPGKRLAEYNVQDTLQLHDLLQALDFQGRQEKKVQVQGETLALDSLVKEAETNIMSLPDRFDPNKGGIKATLQAGARAVDAPLLKMEQLFEWFDKHDPTGVFHRIVVNPLHHAQGLRDDLFVSTGKQLTAAYQGRAWAKTLKNELPNTTLMDEFTGTPRRLTRRNLLAMMLNMGNEGNFEMLHKGFGWDPAAVRAFVDQHARAEDWKWVQGVWDTFGGLEPLIKKAYRELADVAPEMITANEVQTKFGTFKGGYYPLVRDGLRGKDRSTLERLTGGLFQRGQVQPFPANGYTKSRTGAVYALDLDPTVVPAYLRATVHDIAFRGPLIQAQKFLMDSRVQRAVDRTFGDAYSAEFSKYLRDIANDGVSDLNGIRWLNSAIAQARSATIASLIGVNLGTVQIHGGSAAANSIGELAHHHGWKEASKTMPKFVKIAGKEFASDLGKGASFVGRYTVNPVGRGLKRVAKAVTPDRVQEMVADSYGQVLQSWGKNPESFNALWQEAMEQSAEMRHRMHNLDRDLNQQYTKALGGSFGRRNVVALYNNAVTGLVSYSDILTAVPTFICARDMALANGHSLADAIDIGNKTVRQAHGSQGIVDQARIQRGSEFQKMFTMFYGYFSHNYNRNRNTFREAKEFGEAAKNKQYVDLTPLGIKVLTATLFYSLLPSWNHARVRHPHEEDDSWFKWGVGALTTQFTGQIPFVREGGTALVSGYDPMLTPLAGSAKMLVRSANDGLIAAGLKDEKLKHGALSNAIGAAGLTVGAGTKWIGKGTQFIYDVNQGIEHPKDFGEWWRGLQTGHAKERKH